MTALYGFKKTKILSVLLDAFVKFMYININSIAISSRGFESKLKPYVKKYLRSIDKHWQNRTP